MSLVVAFATVNGCDGDPVCEPHLRVQTIWDHETPGGAPYYAVELEFDDATGSRQTVVCKSRGIPQGVSGEPVETECDRDFARVTTLAVNDDVEAPEYIYVDGFPQPGLVEAKFWVGETLYWEASKRASSGSTGGTYADAEYEYTGCIEWLVTFSMITI